MNQRELYPLPIGAETFYRMLLDPDVPDEELRPYLMDGAPEAEFRPVVQINPERVVGVATESALLLGSLNGIARWRRQERYRRKVVSWTGLRIVSEGDSWFQYPLLLTDVIDWLSDPYAVFSLDAAGDLLADMVKQGEVITAVVQVKPHAVLLSGGGNDLLGGSHLSTAVLPYEPGRRPEDYLGDAFDANLTAVLADFERLLSRLQVVAPQTPVLTHVYDWALPANGRWLGKPLAAIGIVDVALQRAIVRAIVDRFHAALVRLAASFAHVTVVDTRGLVHQNQWHDELHPTDPGFRAVATAFAAAIALATRTAAPGIGARPATESAAAVLSWEPGSIGRYPEAALLREIGRRELLAAAGDLVMDEPLAVFPSSADGTYPDLLAPGEQVVAGAGRAALAACCADPSRRRSLEQAMVAGRPATVLQLAQLLSGPDGEPSARAVLIATVLARRAQGLSAEALFSAPSWPRAMSEAAT